MRLAIIALALLCIAAVAPKPETTCRTPCGMTATEGDCEALRGFEGLAIRKVGAVAPRTPDQMCAAVNGWKIKVHPAQADDRDGCSIGWQVVPRFCVKGFTWSTETCAPLGRGPDCDKTIELAHADWHSSSLAHEMIHVSDLARGVNGEHCLPRRGRRSKK